MSSEVRAENKQQIMICIGIYYDKPHNPWTGSRVDKAEGSIMIKGTPTGIEYLCDKCLTPCEKALKPTLIESEQVWEICQKCRKKRDERVKSITSDGISTEEITIEDGQDKSI